MGPQILKNARAYQVDIPTRYSSRQITTEYTQRLSPDRHLQILFILLYHIIRLGIKQKQGSSQKPVDSFRLIQGMFRAKMLDKISLFGE
jgi:hypothetical protein